jgi:hypothetical protein
LRPVTIPSSQLQTIVSLPASLPLLAVIISATSSPFNTTISTGHHYNNIRHYHMMDGDGGDGDGGDGGDGDGVMVTV